MKKSTRVLLNSLIVGLIAGLSSLLSAGYPPDPQDIYAAVIGFALAGLTQVRELVDNNPGSKPPPRLGMLI